VYPVKLLYACTFTAQPAALTAAGVELAHILHKNQLLTL
jgi:hypothetical protein